MRKILLTTTLLVATGVATQVGAFGGFGVLGHKSSHKGGVNAIGVHINVDNKGQPDIKFVDENTGKALVCQEGVVQDQNGFCSICDNGNLYLSYRDDPCGEETKINKQTCSSPEDCESGCCSDNGYCSQRFYAEDFSFCAPENGHTCRSNNDCGSGEFCSIQRELLFPEPPNANWDNFTLASYGECQDLEGFSVMPYNNKVFVSSQIENLSFLAAMNWCHAMGMEMATGVDLGEEDFLDDDNMHGWINKGMQLDSEGYESFAFIENGAIDWSSDCFEDSKRAALCAVNCFDGTYWRDGKCDSACREYEHVMESTCVCDTGFVWSTENKACICPENWHIVNGECAECAMDEVSSDINSTECVPLNCGDLTPWKHQCVK